MANPTRVAARFVEAARPIRLDRRLVEETRDTLVRKLKKWVERNRLPSELLGVELRRPFASATVVMEDVAGRPVMADVHLLSKKSGHPGYVVGAGMGPDSRTGNPAVVVFLNAGDKASAFVHQHSTFPQQLLKNLQHELTHVADTFASKPKYEGGTKKMVEGDPEMDWDEYYNDPKEVRAFMREIVEQIDQKDVAKFFDVFGQTEGMRYLLNMTDWPKMKDHLTPRNRKLMLKGVYTALQDEGLLDEPQASRVAARHTAGEYDPVSCTSRISTGWIDPQGKLYSPLGRFSHEEWATAYLKKYDPSSIPDPSSGLEFADEVLLRQGWTKLSSVREAEWQGRIPLKALSTMAEVLVHCILDSGWNPERKGVTLWNEKGVLSRTGAPAFIRKYGPPQLEDQLFAALMATA